MKTLLVCAALTMSTSLFATKEELLPQPPVNKEVPELTPAVISSKSFSKLAIQPESLKVTKTDKIDFWSAYEMDGYPNAQSAYVWATVEAIASLGACDVYDGIYIQDSTPSDTVMDFLKSSTGEVCIEIAPEPVKVYQKIRIQAVKFNGTHSVGDRPQMLVNDNINDVYTVFIDENDQLVIKPFTGY